MEKIAKYLILFKSQFIVMICLFFSTIFILSDSSVQVLTLKTIISDSIVKITGQFRFFSELYNAFEENKKLKSENIRLSFDNSRLMEDQSEIKRLKELLNLKSISRDDLKFGSIVGWGTIPVPNRVTINLGSKDGVVNNCPVITGRGLVGKILSAGENTSICQLLTDGTFKVSSKLRKTDAVGFLKWKQDDIAEMEVWKSNEIIIGDTVITSEHGNIYPAGIPIGIVSSYSEGLELFTYIEVKLIVDYLKLKDVSVIINHPEFVK